MHRVLTIVTALVAVKCVQLSMAKSVSTFDAFKTIEAEDYNYSNQSYNCQYCTEPMIYLCDVTPTSSVGYYSVDFATGALRANVRVYCHIGPQPGGQSATFHVHLDDPQSPPFASIDLINTGDYCSWTTLSSIVTTIPFGFHDVYLSFTEVNHIDMFYYVDWFSFEATSGNQSYFDAFAVTQAEDFNYTQVAVAEVCPGTSVGYMGSLKADTIIAYYGVDFGTGPQMVQLQIAAWDQGTVLLHLDSALNTPFAYIPIQKIGPDVDTCNFAVVEQFVSTVPTGVHDLYFTVRNPSGVEEFVNIDWFTFKSTITHK